MSPGFAYVDFWAVQTFYGVNSVSWCAARFIKFPNLVSEKGSREGRVLNVIRTEGWFIINGGVQFMLVPDDFNVEKWKGIIGFFFNGKVKIRMQKMSSMYLRQKNISWGKLAVILRSIARIDISAIVVDKGLPMGDPFACLYDSELYANMQLSRHMIRKKSIQLTKWRCHLAFNRRCEELNFIPPPLRIKDPVKNPFSCKVIKDTQMKLLRCRTQGCYSHIRILSKTIKDLICLTSQVVPPHRMYEMVTHITSEVLSLKTEITTKHHKKLEHWARKYNCPKLNPRNITSAIMNLSNATLSLDEEILLAKGMKYRTVQKPDPIRIISGIESAITRLNLQERNIIHDELKEFLSNLSSPHNEPYIYGLPKTHKPETPLRPIVAFFSSPTAPLSRFIANFLKPFLQLQNAPFSIANTQTFIGEVLKIKPESDRIMVSFDVQALYPSLPHPLIISDTIELLQEQHIDTDIIQKITQLITICLDNCIFAYNSESYRQAKGSPMGIPLSTTIAEISMRAIDRRITANFPHDIFFWRRYIDDIFCICTTTKTDDILCNLDNYHPDLHFTVEKETNNTLPFLDVKIIRHQHELHTTVYYKPFFRPNYVQYSSFCPISHKINTVIALSKRVHTHCSLQKYKNLETQNILANLRDCAYPMSFILRHFYDPTKKTQSPIYRSICNMPYSPLSSTIARFLLKFRIKTYFTCAPTSGSLLRNQIMKLNEPRSTPRNAIYSIECLNCPKIYVVTLPSTDRARRCLTSVIGREQVVCGMAVGNRLQTELATVLAFPARKKMEREENRPFCHRWRDPTVFSGERGEDSQRWLSDFQRVARYNKWEDSMCLANVIFYLTGTAKCWFENFEEILNSWEEFKIKFCEIFGNKEDTARKAENIIRTRAQTNGENVESYIQEVLLLCKQSNPRMSEGEKVSHLIKGVAEEVYQALVGKDISTVDQFVAFCWRFEAFKRMRVAPPRFNRLPNVTTISTAEPENLEALIRRRVGKEVQKFMAPPSTFAAQDIDTPPPDLRDVIRSEIQQTLAPISALRQPESFRPRRQYLPQNDQGYRRITEGPPNNQRTQWRTEDDRPICFHCGRPGHVARYCRDRRQAFADARLGRETVDFGRPRTENCTMSESGSELSQEPHNPLLAVPAAHPVAAKDLKLCAAMDCVLPPKSFGKIVVTNQDVFGSRDVVVTGSKRLQLEKGLFIPSSLVGFLHGRAVLWVTNSTHQSQVIPSDMKVGTMQDLEVGSISYLDACSEIAGKNEVTSPDVRECLISMISTDLEETKKNGLLTCLYEFADIFDFEKKSFPVSGEIKHKIDTSEYPPVRQRPYRVSTAERRVIQSEVEKMIETKIIRPSSSPWASLVILVRKKDGSLRFCVDYRRLNKITKKDVYPLPRIDDALDTLSGSRYFSTMDMRSGYWQIEVDDKDREKTAFITPDGLYEFNIMPFGLCNAPVTFERMIDNVLRGLKWDMCLCYLDDIVVYGSTFKEHLTRLYKCHFASRQITILGHVVNEFGTQPDPEKVKAIVHFPKPRNISETRSFLGLSSYYRRFIKSYANKSRPLNSLLKKDEKFIWGEEQDESFRILKQELGSSPVLGHFIEGAETHVHTDASGYGLGAVLVQIQNDAERPIAYASQTLIKAEKNYSTTEKECLAVVWALGKFRPYPYGRPFTVVTDHHSLCWLVGLKDPSGRLARWALKLQEYDINIVYKSGRNHKDADCLSRSPLADTVEIEGHITSIQDIAEEQSKDPHLVGIREKLANENLKGYQMIGGVLYKKNYDPEGKPWLLIVPKQMRHEILKDVHGTPMAGHLGFAKIYDRVRKRFYWPELYRTVSQYIAHCKECQRRKGVPQKPPGLLVPIPPTTSPFQKIAIDYLGRFPISHTGNRWMIVATDYLTRFAITKAASTAEATELATFLIEDVILKHGAPREIITDRGRNFMSQTIREINNLNGTIHRFTTAYHPQTDGLTERLNKTLTDMISIPFFLVHGREVETPLDSILPYQPAGTAEDYVSHLVTNAEDARMLARLNILQAQSKDKERYDKKHQDVTFKVWMFTPVRTVGLSEKLLKIYFGPYRVIRKISSVNYQVEGVTNTRRRRQTLDIVHVVRMKPYHDPEERTDFPGSCDRLFSKIHENKNLSDSDRFLYLRQAIVPNSEAYRVVASYPVTGANYALAVQALQERFGDPNILTELYVRRLLNSVISNVKKENRNLSSLYDELSSHLRSLETLGIDPQLSGIFLYPLVESSLPSDILKIWHRHPSSGYGMELAKREESDKGVGGAQERLRLLLDFLKAEVRSAQRLKFVEKGFKQEEPYKRSYNDGTRTRSNFRPATVSSLFGGRTNIKCFFCERTNHASHQCRSIMKMSPGERNDKVRSAHLCFKCLRKGHIQSQCREQLECKNCGRNHLEVLCEGNSSNRLTKPGRENPKENATEPVASLSSQACTGQVLLMTTVALLRGPNASRRVRILLDSGSQFLYIKQSLVWSIGIERKGEITIAKSLFGGNKIGEEKHGKFMLELENLGNKRDVIHIEALDQRKICDAIPPLPKGDWLEKLKIKGIILSQDNFKGQEIDILIGANYLGMILTGKIVQVEADLTAVETKLGWTLMGNSPIIDSNDNVQQTLNLLTTRCDLKDLWDLEVLGIRDPVETCSKETRYQEIKEKFITKIQRQSDQRYSVGLPWKVEKESILSNLDIAIKRLDISTKKMNSQNKLTEYSQIFRDWLTEGLIERVEENPLERRGYYLPHRPVYKMESKTTPIRPVFDASCLGHNGLSLNQCLEKGPNLLERIPEMMIRFRENKFGVTADIRKAFQMVAIEESERNYLRFLWWEKESDRELIAYRHKRLVFGLNCSPFVLNAVIEYHLQSIRGPLVQWAKILAQSFYMDNCITSLETKQEVQEFQKAAIEIMDRAKMDLREWEYSLEENPEKGTCTKILGVVWNKMEDSLKCELPDNLSIQPKLTKRLVLSMVQRIFDPLGFCAPVFLPPKLLLQRSWGLKLGWDTPLPESMAQEFRTWLDQIKLIELIKIPRYMWNDLIFPTEVHIFCDASQIGYGAVAYLRSETGRENTLTLIWSKVRLAPMKSITIPRLELMAMVLGARLANAIQAALKRKCETTLWSDSTTALSWIKKEIEWRVFVRNRVREIQATTNLNDWRFVPSQLNPADLLSRGCPPSQFVQSRWWEGPEWLKKPKEFWPNSEFSINPKEIKVEENIMKTNINLNIDYKDWILTRRSNYSLNIRVMSYVLRFLGKLKKQSTETGPLKVSELDLAEKKLIRMIQEKVPEEFKTPIILPGDHPFVEQLIWEVHLKNGHVGVQFILSKLKCIACKRLKEKSLQRPMAALPENRIGLGKPFQITGVDLLGPLHLKEGGKVWVAAFTCAVYRAIHLELVKSLETGVFMMALHRFICRRGRPEKIYSDNGTNFAKLNRIFKRLDWIRIERETSIERIQWIFIPPSAPWSQEAEICTTADCPLSSFPEFENLKPEMLHTRYRELGQLKRELKQRFLKEYLGALIQKSENIDRRQLKVGDVVLIGQENLKRMFWPKGRIVNLIPGQDGIVRVAHVKTSTGTLIRALQRLHPLEISSKVETIQKGNSNTEPQSEAFLGNRPNTESRDSRNRYGRLSCKQRLVEGKTSSYPASSVLWKERRQAILQAASCGRKDVKLSCKQRLVDGENALEHFLPQEQMEDKELDLCSQTFVLNVEIKDQRLTRIQEDTLNDKECCLLKQYILTGWPLHKKNLPSNLKPYWEFKEELHEWQNLICRGNKLLIPKTQRSDILKILHASHQGINNTIALAKGFIYWPGMNKEIEELINNCSICQQTSRANLKEPLLPHQAPEYPWQKVGIDIFQIESSKYLLIVDYFSKYPEIYQLQDMTTDTIIRRLKRTFSNFGIPETLVSDNGPPFFSKEFQNFTRTWNIVHVTSSPYHAQSNGMVERTVQTLKKLIKRCGEESTDPYLALLNLRNTPHNNLPSPAQILMSRKLRSIIPSKTSQFVPSMINNEAIQNQLVDNQVKMKNYYDRHTRPADPLSINDRVWFRKDKKWIPGQLKNKANEPRSFYVKDQEGNEYRRNRIHIREDKRSETTHTDWEKPLELNQEQADLQDLEETPSQPTSSGQLSSPGSPENVTTTGPPESCTNGSPGNLITTRSAFYFAFSRGHYDIANYLLEVGANINQNGEYSPIIYKAVVNCTRNVEWLIQNGADVNGIGVNDETPLQLVSRMGQLEVVKLLIEAGANINQADKDGKTPLIEAISGGYIHIVPELLRSGAEVNICEKNKKSPLHYAAESGCLSGIKLLINYGADINCLNENGETPLHQAAVIKDSAKCVYLLLEAGADVRLENNHCQTALELAIEGDCKETIAALLPSAFLTTRKIQKSPYICQDKVLSQIWDECMTELGEMERCPISDTSTILLRQFLQEMDQNKLAGYLNTMDFTRDWNQYFPYSARYIAEQIQKGKERENLLHKVHILMKHSDLELLLPEINSEITKYLTNSDLDKLIQTALTYN
ncbi:hypothetical protein LAZ67_6003537 [Cordylochernes scorpioides]|uniref:RNA-directed DNA polymerase n=1 Tax=Cordylochernes scorpioides TaxID=51811 RepID=A0ABY6KKP7_9ARAC|nr:hypothetical protein LAZ67_6003537 [Cordylochernes scorpioides]